ncbi:Ribonuclease inhibitor [Camelus dromedarius]|uniref:Ribonuclease inhibitor n=1 Tax=Camelus dromedarius TaxID=9838 RepID=A0A5N4BXK4_CAMDR|nr:Ribonuclease inhibitor [Camelus dromedarius]
MAYEEGETSPTAMKLDSQCEERATARGRSSCVIQQYEVVRGRLWPHGGAVQDSVPPSVNSSLTELSLGTNELGDGGVHLVLQGCRPHLQDPEAQALETGVACMRWGPADGHVLSTPELLLTEAGCGALPGLCAPCPPAELHLSNNTAGGRGLQAALRGGPGPQVQLEKLQ